MRAGRHGWRYYDRQAAKKELARDSILKQMDGRERYSDPIKVTIDFHMVIPVSWSRIKRLNAINKPHRSVADLDNLVKFVLDSLNGVLWTDDAIIYEIHARKLYVENDSKTIFTVEPYSGTKLGTLPGLQLDG